MLLHILTKSQERLRSPDVKVTDVAVQLLKVSLPISCYVGLFIDVSRGSGPYKWSDAPNDDASSYYSNNKCYQRLIKNNLMLQTGFFNYIKYLSWDHETHFACVCIYLMF